MFVVETVMKLLPTCFLCWLRFRSHFDILRERKCRPTVQT